MWGNLAAIVVGAAGGFAVGTSVVAFLTVLDLFPRLVQMARAPRWMHRFELTLVAGTLTMTALHFARVQLALPNIIVAAITLFQGAFIGMVAASLIEVLNVVPIVSRRLRMQTKVGILLLFVALGKTAGSLFDWLIFQKHL
jgi:stage V sporulation protein AB